MRPLLLGFCLLCIRNPPFSPSPFSADVVCEIFLKFPDKLNWFEWQAAGNDTGSLWQDPLFVDPATHNYAFAEGSPAFDLGIEQIEVDNIGVQSSGKYCKK